MPLILAFWFTSVAAFIYLVLDSYPLVKSLSALLRTGSFWMLCFVYSVFNALAYGALGAASGERIGNLVGSQLKELALIVLATLGTITILQSLALKVADLKIVDLGSFVDKFKGQVLEDIRKNVAKAQLARAYRVVQGLERRYEGKVDELRNEYASVMAFGGRTSEQIHRELESLLQERKAAGLSLKRALAERIVQVDLEQAERLLRS